MTARTTFFALTENGARLFLRATPGARRDEICGLWTGPDGEARVAVKVAAPPDKGRANAAIVTLLAKRLGLPKSAVAIIAGETSRLKTVKIKGEAAALMSVLAELTQEN